MEIFKIRIADLTVEMRSHFPFAKSFCRDYLVESGTADLIAEVSETEYLTEKEHSPYGVTAESAEIVCLYRKIADRLPEFGRFVFHGAAISYGQNAYLFTAPSGTGKSTHIALWRQYLGEKVDIVNGDKPILRPTESGVTVYSTPWAGKEGWQRNIQMPVKGVCLIERGTDNAVHRIRPEDALMRLLRQTYIPTDPQKAKILLSLFEQFCRKTDFFVCSCDISSAAVKASFEAMTGKTFETETIL